MRWVYWAIVVGVCMSLSPGGILPRDMNSRQYSEWASAQQSMPFRDVKSFTPTWTGFSAAPTGSIFYIDLGAMILMWAEPGLSTGTSNDSSMSFTGVPAAIRPATEQSVIVHAYNASAPTLGIAVVRTDGQVRFQIAYVDPLSPGADKLNFTLTGWWTASQKGVLAPFIYSKQ